MPEVRRAYRVDSSRCVIVYCPMLHVLWSAVLLYFMLMEERAEPPTLLREWAINSSVSSWRAIRGPWLRLNIFVLCGGQSAVEIHKKTQISGSNPGRSANRKGDR